MSSVAALVLLLARTPAARAAPTAPEIASALERLAARPIWPGFDPSKAPLAIYDGKKTWLFRHPASPVGFRSVPGAAGAFEREGRLSEVTANSSAVIGGVVSATLVVGEGKGTAKELAATAIHELVHVYERETHPEWAANEVALLHYPFTNAEALALRRMEFEALRQAVSATERESAAAWAASTLAIRRERFERISSDSAAYERANELNEGLAQFVEDEALGRKSGRLTKDELAPEEIRQRCYATGQAWALLLERFDPEWKGKLGTGASRALRASNATGFVETFEREAVSEAAGPDPLFTGMSRVLVTGLAERPRVVESAEGGVEAEGQGVELRFANARVTREKDRVEIHIGK